MLKDSTTDPESKMWSLRSDAMNPQILLLSLFSWIFCFDPQYACVIRGVRYTCLFTCQCLMTCGFTSPHQDTYLKLIFFPTGLHCARITCSVWSADFQLWLCHIAGPATYQQPQQQFCCWYLVNGTSPDGKIRSFSYYPTPSRKKGTKTFDKVEKQCLKDESWHVLLETGLAMPSSALLGWLIWKHWQRLPICILLCCLEARSLQQSHHHVGGGGSARKGSWQEVVQEVLETVGSSTCRPTSGCTCYHWCRLLS